MIGDNRRNLPPGRSVTVKLVEAAPVAGALRFELLSEGRYDGRKAAARPPRRQEDRNRGDKRRGKTARKAPTMITARDAWPPCCAAGAALPELRRRPHVPRVPQGRRPLPACGEALHHHRADDAPAYFVILIVGHIVVPVVLIVETAFAPVLLDPRGDLAAVDRRAVALSPAADQRHAGRPAVGAAHARLQSGASRQRRTRAQPYHRTAPMTDIDSDRIAADERFRTPHERGRSRPLAQGRPAERRGDADPGRSFRARAEGAARQAPCAPQVHARQVRVSRRRCRPDRQAHAGREARSIRSRKCG